MYVYVCCVYIFAKMRVWRSLDDLRESISVLLPSGTQGKKLCGQAWWQAPLPPVPFWWCTGDIFARLWVAQDSFSESLLGTTMGKRLESSLVRKDKTARSNYVPTSSSGLPVHSFVRRKEPEILKHMNSAPHIWWGYVSGSMVFWPL